MTMEQVPEPQANGSLNIFLPFDRMEKQSDGTLRVFAEINDETVDDQGEIVDYDGAKAALDEFMKFANVREMHQPSAVGVVEAISHDDLLRKSTGVLHIVDTEAVKKIAAGVYKGTSLGGWKRDRVTEMHKASGKPVIRVRKPIVNEVSLVDRPSRATALLSMMKVSDITEPPAEADPEPLALPDVPAAADAEPLAKSTGEDATPGADSPASTPAAGDGEPAAGDTYIGPDGRAIVEEPMAKRDIPQDERDKMPAADFAGPHESFPIQTPADVSAAAHLVGKAASPDSVKSRIIAIAHRKGAAFEAKLPKAWVAAKSSGSDAAYAMDALETINCLLEGEVAEGDEEDVAFLKSARDSMLAFVDSESKEIGATEQPVEMAYAAVIGDLAKMSEGVMLTPAQRAVRVLLVPDYEANLAMAKAGIAPTPTVDYNALAQEVAKQLEATLPQRETLSAVQSGISSINERLEKIAKQPVSGGPLRYAADDRRFKDLAGLMDSPESNDNVGDFLAKRAAVEPDPIVREALGRAAAARKISDLQQR